MKKTIIVLTMLLVGCSSAKEVRQSQPVLSGETHKSVQNFSACVSEEWGDIGLSNPPIALPIESGQSIQILNEWGKPAFILDIEHSENINKFKYYVSTYRYVNSSFKEAILKCK